MPGDAREHVGTGEAEAEAPARLTDTKLARDAGRRLNRDAHKDADGRRQRRPKALRALDPTARILIQRGKTTPTFPFAGAVFRRLLCISKALLLLLLSGTTSGERPASMQSRHARYLAPTAVLRR